MTSTPAEAVLDETDPGKPDRDLDISKEDDHLFLSLENYCWEDDPEFQSGLTQILSSTSPSPPEPSLIRHLTRQAKCFFYSRKISRPISFPLYNAWLDREEARSIPRCNSPSCKVGPPLEPAPVDEVSAAQNVLSNKIITTPLTGDTPKNSRPPPAAAGGSGQENAAVAEGKNDSTPYPTSFAEIVELITSGKPIPGIREIPNTLNAAPPTQSTVQQRRKPWEVVDSAATGVPEAAPNT